MHNWAIKLRLCTVINIFSQNVSEPLSITAEDKNIILKAYSTQKCFTIAIKTIQLLARIIIIKHDEFINANFSSKIFFETNNIFAIRGKNPFLFHYVGEEKKLNRVKYTHTPQYCNKINFRIKPFP